MSQTNLLRSLSFIEALIRHRVKADVSEENSIKNATEVQPPNFLADEQSPFSQYVLNQRLAADELVVLLLGLIPHIYPHFFDSIVAEFLPKGGEFPAFGGVKGTNHRGTIPTGETALYLLAGNNLERRFQVQQIFGEEHLFAKQNVLSLESVKYGEPPLSGRIILDDDFVDLFTIGKQAVPKMSASFPAQHITTALNWDDLVLHSHTLAQIQDLETWIKHHDTLMNNWGMNGKLKPGYRALFYGPPGTGKTLTATLLGKFTGKDVFRIDLSSVVSKYIGETEKNLASLFDKAKNKNWILFFDEADAVFGKRTSVRDAHDKYANQEVSYLLQRVEAYNGLTILSSNFKDNIDEAFTRRFNAMIYFPKPKPAERLVLWQKGFPEQVQIGRDLDLNQISKNYDLTGSHIMNIVQYACLQAIAKRSNIINKDLLMRSIHKELAKEGKTA